MLHSSYHGTRIFLTSYLEKLRWNGT
ncbi:hypothetical protein LDENG_00251780 [Lucifuga dentata]|nr:hypothetical protein LDENG_00251780 [Lucifuga dentata]